MKKFNLDFVGKRLIFATLSTLLIIFSILLIGLKGLNWGIDFSGGTIIEIKAEQQTLEEIRSILNNKNLGSYTLQEFGGDGEYVIKIGEKIEDNSVANEIVESLNAELRRLEYVGPQIGEELTEKGLLATVFSLIAILLYVSVRFQLRFAMGAVIALFHDVMLTLGIFALMGKEFTLPVLAAILTIIGYSLNDTIVVYDRIRENLNAQKEEPDGDQFIDLINKSIKGTLRRTLMTSLTTLLVLFALYLFGGAAINDFAFALLFGIVVGTYSSIFVASPVLLYLDRFAPKDTEEEQEDFSKFNKYTD
jgi:preprotein translocase subunit SecF